MLEQIDRQSLEEAVNLLKKGDLVAFPTETVYGLGADARNPEALSKIFLAKERPFTHPLIVHLASPSQLSAWALEVPESALLLAKAFWPGPLTLILKKRPEVNDLLTGNQDSIGLRIPAHPLALALLEAFGDGIAAPSANRFSRLSPTTAEAVREELGAKVACVLEGGVCEVGIESTILDLSRGQPVILRPGMISAAQLEKVLGQPVGFSREAAPRVSGMDMVHYAPNTPLSLVTEEQLPMILAALPASSLPVALLTHQGLEVQQEGVNRIVMGNEPAQYAQELYLTLRALDKQGFKKILVEALPPTAEWSAINDRLQKAAARNK